MYSNLNLAWTVLKELVNHRENSIMAENRKDHLQRMNQQRKFLKNQRGQGLVEYTFVVVLVALVFWLGAKNTNMSQALTSTWSVITNCAADPFNCSSGS